MCVYVCDDVFVSEGCIVDVLNKFLLLYESESE